MICFNPICETAYIKLVTYIIQYLFTLVNREFFTGDFTFEVNCQAATELPRMMVNELLA